MNVPPPGDVEEILLSLRTRGGRVTPGRRAVLEVLLDAGDQHMSADDVVDAVRSRLPATAASTVYRTLSTLEGLGVVNHVHLGHGPATYHLTASPHHHLVCRRCGTVIELPATRVAGFARAIERDYGFALQDAHFALSGVCRACRSAG